MTRDDRVTFRPIVGSMDSAIFRGLHPYGRIVHGVQTSRPGVRRHYWTFDGLFFETLGGAQRFVVDTFEKVNA